MRIGDLLEWLAGAALVAASYLWHRSLPLALLALFVVLIYEAQSYGATPFPKIPRRKADK